MAKRMCKGTRPGEANRTAPSLGTADVASRSWEHDAAGAAQAERERCLLLGLVMDGIEGVLVSAAAINGGPTPF